MVVVMIFPVILQRVGIGLPVKSQACSTAIHTIQFKFQRKEMFSLFLLGTIQTA